MKLLAHLVNNFLGQSIYLIQEFLCLNVKISPFHYIRVYCITPKTLRMSIHHRANLSPHIYKDFYKQDMKVLCHSS